jgi:hypothetical protein
LFYRIKMIEKVSKSVIEYFVEEISTAESKEKIKRQVIDPIFMYIVDKIYPFVIITSIIFILTFLIAILILFMILRKNYTTNF